ncbi:MAG TPA: hypothetical protein VEN81_08320, partial [Planctomycetota bacterium]|nr:hypothetical protein [Planctomycetota bacterium]
APHDPPGAGDFTGLQWVDGAPDLGGRVRLVRWWTHPCALCSGSAPALARLAVKAPLVAVFRPEPGLPVTVDEVRERAHRVGMPGILAIDREGAVLDRWAPPASRTEVSLTFLLDAHGRARYIHPGGLLGPEDEDHLAQRIDALLAEKN